MKNQVSEMNSSEPLSSDGIKTKIGAKQLYAIPPSNGVTAVTGLVVKNRARKHPQSYVLCG